MFISVLQQDPKADGLCRWKICVNAIHEKAEKEKREGRLYFFRKYRGKGVQEKKAHSKTYFILNKDYSEYWGTPDLGLSGLG